MKPAEADFGVTIDFAKGESDPVKVFEALAVLLEGFREFDRLTIGALDPHIEPIMVLEDVHAASVTAWLRNRLRQVDDGALKDLDWKKQVGAYAVKAKYRALEYLDQKVEEDERQRLQRLRSDLLQLATEPQFRHLALPQAIPLQDLVVPLDRIQDAKALLGKSDRLLVKTDDSEYEVNLAERKTPSAFLGDPAVTTADGQMPMTLLVRKPDYLGDTRWEFRHGKQTIEAHVRDREWLARFRAGQELVLPGSALACMVDYEYGYDTGGELVSQKHTVSKVLNVINQAHTQDRLPDV